MGAYYIAEHWSYILSHFEYAICQIRLTIYTDDIYIYICPLESYVWLCYRDCLVTWIYLPNTTHSPLTAEVGRTAVLVNRLLSVVVVLLLVGQLETCQLETLL